MFACSDDNGSEKENRFLSSDKQRSNSNKRQNGINKINKRRATRWNRHSVMNLLLWAMNFVILLQMMNIEMPIRDDVILFLIFVLGTQWATRLVV